MGDDIITISTTKRILFLTGTRADFGKIKPLLNILEYDPVFSVYIFVTGMHMHRLYGETYTEVEACGYKNIYKYINQTSETTMDLTLSKTIEGLSSYIKEFPPDMIVVHGDRVETLAGAIVGSLNNIIVAHIEGGEVSGTIDDLIRHAVTKMSHIHFVSNNEAMQRLIQLGESSDFVFDIGSPDMDVMFSDTLPSLTDVKRHYEIEFDNYSIVMYHPVTTEYNIMESNAKQLIDVLLEDQRNYVVIYPNNDLGSNYILKEYGRLDKNKRFRIFPSIRFEYFLTLLKYSNFIIGNSSAGIREASAYGIPSVNIGSRQNNRAFASSIINCKEDKSSILKAIEETKNIKSEKKMLFGKGNSSAKFHKILSEDTLWKISKQKRFNDYKDNNKKEKNVIDMPIGPIAKRIAERDIAVNISLDPSFPVKRFSIEITNACNHKCVFCFHSKKRMRKVGFIDEKLFKRVLNEAYQLGTREIGIGLNGEPFANKNLEKYIKFANDIGYSYVFVTSNGSLATPERLKIAIDSGLNSIRFSINAGKQETYKKVHGKDDYDIVKKNLLWLAKYKNEKNIRISTSVSFVVNSYNYYEIDSFKEQFSGLVDDIIFMQVRNVGGYMPETKLMINEDVRQIPLNHEKCVFPFNGVVVTWEGYLTACCFDFQNYLAVADLNKISLKDAWYGENMKKLRQRFIDNDFSGTICQLCKGGNNNKPEPLVKELCTYNQKIFL